MRLGKFLAIVLMLACTPASRGQSMPGQSIPLDLPAMHVGAHLTVADVAASGDITYTIAFTDIEVALAH